MLIPTHYKCKGPFYVFQQNTECADAPMLKINQDLPAEM